MKPAPMTEAIIAVTLNCNARCVMCNIWKNRIKGEMGPEVYLNLPPSLTTINITGGEPFLRPDLPEIIGNMKRACPKARLIINTNGYLTSRIKTIVPKLLTADPRLALRVSLDGKSKTHDQIRGLPQFYQKAMESLAFCRKAGVRDLGISYTLMEQNKNDLPALFSYCKKNGYEFSLTVATDSPIYFGEGKMRLRPAVDAKLVSIFKALIGQQYSSLHLKSWVRAWFNKQLIDYMKTGRRRLRCQAGEDFFYMDSFGKAYVCQMKPWLIGDLAKEPYEKVFAGSGSKYAQKSHACHDCWMVCSARASIKNNAVTAAAEIAKDQILSGGKPDIKPGLQAKQ